MVKYSLFAIAYALIVVWVGVEAARSTQRLVTHAANGGSFPIYSESEVR